MFDITRKYSGRIVVRPIDFTAAPSKVLEVLAGRQGAVFFESSATHGQWGRYTIAACRPMAVLTMRDGLCRMQWPADDRGVDQPWPTAEAAEEDPKHEHGPPLRVHWSCGRQESLVALLRRVLNCVRSPLPTSCCYGPGWMGCLGYELGRYFERLPSRAIRDTSVPDLYLAFYESVLVYDNLTDSWQLASLQFDEPPDGVGQGERALLAVMREAHDLGPEVAVPPAAPACDDACFDHPRLTSNFTRAEYLGAVARCVEYIA
ncbi:MAG: hypothetical protein HQ546_02305, partial [Planctomycetes bacterium]|nr:hypothetical protein [Planctomycetota bacterium]